MSVEDFSSGVELVLFELLIFSLSSGAEERSCEYLSINACREETQRLGVWMMREERDGVQGAREICGLEFVR